MSENKEFDDYLKSLCESLGYSEEETLLPSAHGNDRLRWAAMIQLKVIDLKAQLSSKEQELKDSALLYQNVVNTLQTKQQECEKLNKTVEAFRVRDEKRELRFSKANKENGGLYAKNEALESELSTLRAECDDLKIDVESYKLTIDLERAENERLKHELSYFDPINRVRELRKRCEDLEAALKKFECHFKGYSIQFEEHCRKLLSQ